ncbi:kinase-like domain-containing protein [Aspergillus pseudotamarii]|uniref:Altered inheritance of mitochondria protein 9, mitochondrial n=1 Tax=Aspergillus pseudotamarii TaxID=132259 RepID=A0A5N6SU57_ASPPS|nr:kinase-like domain-containing protein [Aspergillus pseudotamarii]KAE8137321.1 kinase-like domain-containing protein [Aspergillus pseudotamarii]
MREGKSRMSKMASAPSKLISRNISLSCRGQPIQSEQLFEYTNGRFLANEGHERSKRYARFNLDALCTLVSSLPTVSSPISKIDNMEGYFNKAMLMTAENGKEIIAKIPCPQAVPPESRTSIPALKAIAWSSDSSNPVGSKYILLEKADGRQLVDVWGDMDQLQRFQLIKNLARLEGELTSMEFPGYGNLYFNRPASHHSGQAIPVDDEYCLGPAYNASWFPQSNKGCHSGPWKSISDLGLSLASRGLGHIQRSTLVTRGPHFGTKVEHSRILEAAMDVIPKLAGHPTIQRYSRPTLWHGDLHLGNIYICDQDPTDIVGIIDWQFMSIMPAFMQVQWPYFLSPPENYETGLVKPELPPNFDAMDSDEKAFAMTERDQALLSKCYEAALTKQHLQSYFALTRVDSAIRHLFTSCGTTWKDGIIPLRDSLIQISEHWNEMGFSGPCPFPVTGDVLSKHRLELSRYKDWHKLKSYTQELLQSDDDGWVPPQLDYDKVQDRHAELFQLYMQRETEEISEEEARELWFYKEGS